MDASRRAHETPVTRGLWVWLATGCGIGRLPWAPGTWGSAAGCAIGWALAGRLSPAAGLAGLALTLVLFAWVSGLGERQLQSHDPPSFILDEIWGMAAILLLAPQAAARWLPLACAFLFFRFFDTVKPPPLKLLARLPGGWGIMADDVGAAAYALALTWLVLRAGV